MAVFIAETSDAKYQALHARDDEEIWAQQTTNGADSSQ
jgi:hypothetical protein